MRLPRIALLAPGQPLLRHATAQLLDEHRAALPDLSHVTVLLPQTGTASALREQLVEQAGALLGPQLLTLAAYAEQRGHLPAPLSALDCRLRLTQVLAQRHHLFPGQDSARLAEDFLALFEELSAQTPALADDLEGFLARVRRGYGRELKLFSDEARTVHTLWRAWLEETGGNSPGLVHAQRLRRALERQGQPLYLVGFDAFSASESAALRTVLARDHVHLWLQGRREGRDGAALQRLCQQLGIEPEPVGFSAQLPLDVLFDPSLPLRQRVASAALPAGLRIQPARSAEHEARLADVAIRRWLLAGKRRIAVIAQDRRFARRLRALLERAGIALRDEAGWALSTSSAAAALVDWLDCVEQDFHFRPLLGLLRSAFHDADPALVDEFEHKLLSRRERTVAGLRALRGISETAPQLLQPLEQAAGHLVLHAGPRPAAQWSTALLRSLQALPLWETFHADTAGQNLAEVLQELDGALQGIPLTLDWPGFRALLQSQLEQATFTPSATPSPVRLLTLEQARALHCDAFLLSGATTGSFPGKLTPPSVFNQAVRQELGLPLAQDARELALARFRGLLEAADSGLITYAPDEDDGSAQPGAWIELLQAAGIPGDAELTALAATAATEVTQREPYAPMLRHAPRPPAVPDLLPTTLSASAHQALVNCPYRFHAERVLRLYEISEPDEPYSRLDFGERVHEVLRHFTEPVHQADRDKTAERMTGIALKVFGPDLRARALSRAWLAEFESRIPDLVNWLIERKDWPQAQAEQELQRTLGKSLVLKGRIDRLEQDTEGASRVVDYKTGAAPASKAIRNGEQVQAVHYALLTENCQRIEYLQIQREALKSTIVEDEDLSAAAAGVAGRIMQVMLELHGGAAQPAHGDAQTCERCQLSGLCRRGAWHE